MSVFFRAGTALVFAALIGGHLPASGPYWRTVAAGLAHARPEARLKAEALALLRGQEG